MPLLPFTPETITLPVTDRVYNDTIIKQKATFSRLAHQQTENCSNVVIDVTVTMYANENGDYGLPLTGQGFQPYTKSLGADNNTLVDAETGEILLVRTTETDDMWRATADLYPKDIMFQTDFFVMLRDNAPIRIGDLIKQHITQADALGRFK